MSGICGWLSLEPNGPQNHETLDHMVKRLGPAQPGSYSQQHGKQGSLGGAGLAGITGRYGDVLVAIQGCPVWGARAAREWVNSENFGHGCATAYREAGPLFLEHLNGQFALSIIDENRGTLLLAIDRTGTETLSYAHIHAGIAFATTADSLTAHPAIERRLDPQSLFNYVHFHVVPGPGGAYQNLRRLLPGHYLHLSDGITRLEEYWRPDYSRISYENFSERKNTLRTLLRESVSDALCSGRAGAFLSGGTDSSTVAGVMTEILGEGVPTYSIGFDAPGYDESEYARTASRHFKTKHHEYYVTPEDVVEAVPLIARTFDTPFGNASAIPAYYCARLAADDGVDTLLGGDGGDELFGGNERYAKQWVFSLYDQLPGAMRRSIIEPIVNRLPSIMPARKLRSYVQQANLGMPDRIESYNLLNRLGTHHVFTEEFLDTVDTGQPIELVRQIYRDASANDMINRMLALDMRITLADNDLRKVTGACDAAGMRVTFPLLDRRLMEFAQTLPPDWKVKRTRLRDFFKRALADFLPHQVITKSKHGFGLPFGVWMQTHDGLHSLAHDSLAKLRNRAIVRPEFIDELTTTHMAQHAGYYGTMIWILMMLEQWLDSRGL